MLLGGGFGTKNTGLSGAVVPPISSDISSVPSKVVPVVAAVVASVATVTSLPLISTVLVSVVIIGKGTGISTL